VDIRRQSFRIDARQGLHYPFYALVRKACEPTEIQEQIVSS